MAQSQIQSKYMGEESDCRSYAEDQASHADEEKRGDETTRGVLNPVDGKFIAARAFSECMNKSGWKLTTPKQTAATSPPSGAPGPGGTVAKAPPAQTANTTRAPVNNPPSGAPGPGGTVAARKAPATTTTPASPIIGPGVQPAPSPAFPAPVVEQPATVYTPKNPNVSTYQPGK